MKKTRNCMLTLLALLALGLTVRGQDASTETQDAPTRATARATGQAVTISVTDHGVRFAALGSFGKMRLEVFNADGTSLYNSDFGAASVRDWVLDNKDGQPLPDGTYLCVITIRDLSGKLSTKQGSVVLQSGQPSLKLPDGETVEVVEPDKSLARVNDPLNTALTLIGHDGQDGQIVNTRGAMTFRFGDFFSGKDKELMRLTPEGNLGLGVKSPQAKLDVAGTIRANGIEFPNGTMQTTGLSGHTDAQGSLVPAVSGTGTTGKLTKWTDGPNGTLGDSPIASDLNGNIGIGTSNPDSLLNVQGAIPSLLGHMSAIRTTGSNNGFGLLLDATGSGNNNLGLAVNGALKGGLSWDNSRNFVGFVNLNYSQNDFALRLNADGSLTYHDGNTSVERFRITNSGNVGIGTNNPQSPLDVNGNFNVTGNATVSGNIAAKYQDIAEWTAARTELPSGTVVSLDTLKPNSVMASDKAYDTRVAGVVSAQPGVILGEGGPNRVLVATTGRVKVKVNANRYPIHIGDLLVTSNTPGVAMKSQPFHLHGKTLHRPGTIIGKALESLHKGDGTILVLLSLQ